MAVTISGNKSSVVYGKGDVCLKLNPYDNFRLFTLYEDWRDSDRKPIDLSNGQELYLVFKDKNKEIRIPEYDMIDSDYTVDKVNGQVLFKISEKNSTDILNNMGNDVFYITRVYRITDYAGSKNVASDEEVIYSGRWKDETANTVDDYSSQLKNAAELLDNRNKQIKDLMESNANLLKQNTELAEKLAELQEENARLKSELTAMDAKLADYESGNEYEGTIIGDATHHTIITNRQYTEDELKDAIDALETKTLI